MIPPRCPLGYPNHEHFRRGIVSDVYHISPPIDTIFRPSFFLHLNVAPATFGCIINVLVGYIVHSLIVMG